MHDEDAALYQEYGDDPELAFAIKMSMMEEEAKRTQVPDEPDIGTPNSVNLQFRLSDGSKLQRRFLTSHKIQDLINFIKKSSGKMHVTLSTSFPKKVFDNISKTLAEVGITKNEALIAEIKQ